MVISLHFYKQMFRLCAKLACPQGLNTGLHMTNMPAISVSLGLDNLGAYTRWVHTIPILSLAEERSLTSRYHADGNLAAAKQLVLAHLRVVVKLAKKYSGYGLSQADLIQEGNVGLMKAVKRFDPEHGVRLISFAIHWIRAEMHEFIIRNWRIVKVATTKAQRKLFFNLRSMKKRLGWFKKHEIDEVAEHLNVAPETVVQMESRLSVKDAAYDPIVVGDETRYAPADYLTAANSNPEMLLMHEDSANNQHEQLMAAFEKLDARSQLILNKRWFAEKKTTLQVLAKTLNMSAERVRQLEKQAMQQLKSALGACTE
jgi:RNA polymerase sigma-32 factor